MEKVSFVDKFRYAFDNIMSKGPVALIGWLGVLSVLLIVIISLIIWSTNIAPDYNFVQIVWMSLMRTLDAGTMGGDTGPWAFLFGMFAVTLGGIFIISTLIGILTTGIEAKLEMLRKGRSRVIEEGHTVILGWSEQIFSIISELVIANENQRKSCIVIMADRDKVEMEDEIRSKVGSTKRTRVVCRQGSPMDLTDIEIVSVNTAKSIIILAPDSDDPDSNVIKTILAITNNPKRREKPYHIVAEIRDPKNFEVAKMIGNDEVELLLIGNLVSRIIAQTCLQSGLSVVYVELLDFGGDEIYFVKEPTLIGKTFGESLFKYEDSAVIGIYPEGKTPILNPQMDTVIQDEDQLIVIAEDDDKIFLSGITDYKINENAISPPVKYTPSPRRILILGWNWRAPLIINDIDNYVSPGSEVMVVASYEDGENEISKYCSDVRNVKVSYKIDDTTDRRVLNGLAIETYNHVIILCYSNTLDTQEADAMTLITLLHLREIADKTGHKFTIVSEMLDIRNRNLAEVTRADDFIVSDRLVSLMLSHVSENKHLNAVFNDIFDPEGSEIYLKPAENYVKLGVPVNFYTVLDSACQRGEVAFGYRLRAYANDVKKSYGIVINPDKSNLITFSQGDKVIVAAES
ncbi:MAG: CASTOR/POLLUX-related putative ion channel [bacterium]